MASSVLCCGSGSGSGSGKVLGNRSSSHPVRGYGAFVEKQPLERRTSGGQRYMLKKEEGKKMSKNKTRTLNLFSTHLRLLLTFTFFFAPLSILELRMLYLHEAEEAYVEVKTLPRPATRHSK